MKISLTAMCPYESRLLTRAVPCRRLSQCGPAPDACDSRTYGRIAVFTVLCAVIAWAGELPTPVSALLDEAVQSNPDILAARRAWQAATQVPSQVSTMPDPQVTVQHLSVGSPRPFAGYSSSDFAYIGLGVSQDLPYPGKLKLRGEAAERDAGVTRQKVESVTRSVLVQVKEAYLQLGYIQASLVVLDRNDKLLEQIEKIADARYRVGQGTQQDVLKAQLERTKLQLEVVHHHNVMQTQQALMQKLLNRTAASPDVTTEPLIETPLSHDVDELLGKIRTEN